jgi:magnesium chelatase family protein
MMVPAMNPCPCGLLLTDRECRCTSGIVQRYLGKISGPLLDRIDLHIDVPAVPYKEMRSSVDGVTSEVMRECVVRARAPQKARGFHDALLPPGMLRKAAALDDAGERSLEMAVRRLKLPARAHDCRSGFQ